MRNPIIALKSTTAHVLNFSKFIDNDEDKIQSPEIVENVECEINDSVKI